MSKESEFLRVKERLLISRLVLENEKKSDRFLSLTMFTRRGFFFLSLSFLSFSLSLFCIILILHEIRGRRQFITRQSANGERELSFRG